MTLIFVTMRNKPILPFVINLALHIVPTTTLILLRSDCGLSSAFLLQVDLALQKLKRVVWKWRDISWSSRGGMVCSGCPVLRIYHIQVLY